MSLDYRLAPEHPFADAVEAAVAAFRWLAATAGKLGIDAKWIAIGGDGIGGGLAAEACQIARDAGGAMPAFQFLLYPIVDMSRKTASRDAFASGYFMTEPLINWFADHYIATTRRRDPRASPLLASSFANLPPALVVTAGFDPMLDEDRAYGARVREAGVAIIERHYPGMVHGLLNMSAILDEAKWAIDEAAVMLLNAMSNAQNAQ